MTLGSLCLSFERAKLAADFSQQVLHAQQVGLGCVEATLSLFLALTELQHPGSFFDDRPAVFWASVEHRIDLALAHDDVLLPTDSSIAEEFLDVEQATTDAIDHVLGLTGAEQDARDGDLAEL